MHLDSILKFWDDVAAILVVYLQIYPYFDRWQEDGIQNEQLYAYEI